MHMLVGSAFLPGTIWCKVHSALGEERVNVAQVSILVLCSHAISVHSMKAHSFVYSQAEGAASSPGVVVAALRSASDGVEPPARKRLVKDFDRESDDERNVTESQPDGRGSGVTRSGGAGAHAKGEAPRRPSPPTQEQESPERVPGKVAELENPVRAPDRPANGEEPAGVASEKEGCVKTPGASMSALSPASVSSTAGAASRCARWCQIPSTSCKVGSARLLGLVGR